MQCILTFLIFSYLKYAMEVVQINTCILYRHTSGILRVWFQTTRNKTHIAVKRVK